MFLTEAGCGLVALILCISGIRGERSFCALNGSTVTLNCSTPSINSSSKWFSKQSNGSGSVLTEVSADERHAIHTSDKNQSTLTIKNLTESDAKVYCCGKTSVNTNSCDQHSVQLRVTGLRVIVSQSDNSEHNVKLTCNTSCKLTNNPAAYIWFRDAEPQREQKSFFYTDVNRRKTIQCGVEGSDKLKSPEVSLQRHNDTCVKVTPAAGKTCSLNKSDDCFICRERRNHHNKDKANTTAAVCGASAAALVVLPAVVFIWISTRRTLQQLSSTEEGHVTPPSSSAHVYESIPAPPPQHDDVYYSTIVFQPKESQRGAYAVVRFRPDV